MCTGAVKDRGKKKGRIHLVNTKCPRAIRQAEGWSLLSVVQFVMLLPSSLRLSLPSSLSRSLPISLSIALCSFFLMFLSLFLFLHITLSPCFLPSLTAWSLYPSNLLLCVCLCGSVLACMCVPLCVGDKAFSQHCCVYKTCLLLLIALQHNVSAQLAMHVISPSCSPSCSFIHTHTYTHVPLVCFWERPAQREGCCRLGKKWKVEFHQEVNLFSLITVEHPFSIRKFLFFLKTESQVIEFPSHQREQPRLRLTVIADLYRIAVLPICVDLPHL